MESSGKYFVLLLTIGLFAQLSKCDTRYFVKLQTNSTMPMRKIIGVDASKIIDDRGTEGSQDKINNRAAKHPEKSRSTFRIDDDAMIRESLKTNLERRNSFVESSTFDPDVLNKFLDDYANKIKSTTEKNFNFPFRIGKPDAEKVYEDNRGEPDLENNKDIGMNKTMENSINSTLEITGLNQQESNDTIKRNKYYGANPNDDRNGWVTLEAIPWSKSKISKWQASSSSQRPWPEMKIWDKPNNGKPWTSEFPSRPAYINNEPWHDAPKPLRPNYQSNRPSSRPQSSTRPSYFEDRLDHNPNQAQKWPTERPQSSWDKFPSLDSYRPNMDIITDDRPSDFPNTWDKYTSNNNNNNNNDNNKYSYNDRDRFTNKGSYENNNYHPHDAEMSDDWRDGPNNYPSKSEYYKDKPTDFGRPSNDHQNSHNNRPQHSSHYQYTPDHPLSHPSSGEGQWVLLSTNRGYSKSRQRSMKMEPVTNMEGSVGTRLTNLTIPIRTTKQENDGTIAVMTSKRQVRLTVLPSINGNNTITSHGGLLEVEKTFKTVDQSRKDYEDNRLTSLNQIDLIGRPMRNTFIARPSNSAVLAAVGAGMLPATMAMMIPMMLGRKKRSSVLPTIFRDEKSSDAYYRGESSISREELDDRRERQTIFQPFEKTQQ